MSDVLQRASKALREGHTGANPGSGFTRARILRSVHDGKRRRWSRWALIGPLAAIFLGGTAWAGATGKLPEWWSHAEAWVTTLNGPNQPATAEVQPGRAQPPRPAAVPALEPTRAPAPPPEEIVEPDEAAAEEALEEEVEEFEPVAIEVPDVRPRPARVRKAPPPPPPAPPAEPEPTPEVERDPEIRAFRRAHDLHFKSGQPGAAIAAYGEYLRAYPRGRFVPEARYNTALNLLKTGEHERARQLLESFARGDYGAYRQTDARRLLDAMAR